MYSVKKIFSLLTALLFFAPSAYSVEVVSKINASYEKSDAYRLLNNQIRKGLNIPYYFNVPFSAFSPLAETTVKSNSSNLANPAILFNYRESRTSLNGSQRADANTLGLRLIAVNGTESRTKTSQTLAESGMIQTGDILLSFRPEWYGTLRYSHIQLGVSHAGVAFVDVDPKDGKKYVYNLDMPMNHEYVGKIDSEHYQGLNVMHVLRLKDMNEAQRANLLKWYKLINARKATMYPAQISFNQDYSAPRFKSADDLTFIGDVGRLALGMKTQQAQSMYCSEYSWSLLSLRNCDPDKDGKDFGSQGTPACVSMAFDPMPVFGNLYDTKADGKQVIGMSDGPMILADVLGAKGAARQRLLHYDVFRKADGNPENISSGHKAVEAALLTGNPQIYDYFEKYYLSTVPGAEGSIERSMIKKQFNESMSPNYSPTAFQMHAILPPQFNGVEITAKKIDYVGTVGFFKPVKVGGKTVDLYQTLKSVKAN